MNRTTQDQINPVDIAIVGGGLAGLTAAGTRRASRALGRRYRAITSSGGTRSDKRHCRGAVQYWAHAHLFPMRGAAHPQRPRCQFTGHLPRPGRALAFVEGELLALPISFGSLVRGRLLSWREKLAFARLFAGLQKSTRGAGTTFRWQTGWHRPCRVAG